MAPNVPLNIQETYMILYIERMIFPGLPRHTVECYNPWCMVGRGVKSSSKETLDNAVIEELFNSTCVDPSTQQSTGTYLAERIKHDVVDGMVDYDRSPGPIFTC